MKIPLRAFVIGSLPFLCGGCSSTEAVEEPAPLQPLSQETALEAPLEMPVDPSPAGVEPMDGGPMVVLDGEGVFYVEGPEPKRPRVRYQDGQVSLNQSCAIQLGNKLNRKIPPVYVNGRPVGFC